MSTRGQPDDCSEILVELQIKKWHKIAFSQMRKDDKLIIIIKNNDKIEHEREGSIKFNH